MSNPLGMAPYGWEQVLKDPDTYLDEWHQSARSKIAEVKARTDLTESGKAERIAKVKEDTNRKIDAVRDAIAAARVEHVEGLRKKIFRPATPVFATASDKIAIDASLRDALDRAGRTEFAPVFNGATPSTRSADLAAMLERAVVTDDRVQAKAALVVAIERDDQPVIESYMQAFPHESADIDAFYSATHVSTQASFADAARFVSFQ